MKFIEYKKISRTYLIFELEVQDVNVWIKIGRYKYMDQNWYIFINLNKEEKSQINKKCFRDLEKIRGS